MAELEFWVNGMTCAHCERAIAAELVELPGIADVTVDAASGRVTVTHAEPLSREAVDRAVADAGYMVRSWPGDDTDG